MLCEVALGPQFLAFPYMDFPCFPSVHDSPVGLFRVPSDRFSLSKVVIDFDPDRNGRVTLFVCPSFLSFFHPFTRGLSYIAAQRDGRRVVTLVGFVRLHYEASAILPLSHSLLFYVQASVYSPPTNFQR